MPPATTNTPSPMPATTPKKKVLSAIHNLPKRMRSATLRTQPSRAPGKENMAPSGRPPATRSQTHPRPTVGASKARDVSRSGPLLPKPKSTGPVLTSPRPRDLDLPFWPPPLPNSTVHTHNSAAAGAAGRWAAQDGQIVLKIWVPSTDDVWKLRVPEDASLEHFRARVEAKIGFRVSFASITAGQLRTVGSEEEFRAWVAARVDADGRNRPLTAHRLVLQ
ncbi:hypothetical protein C8Q80DRAFT_1121610 [Daedaleopsis nitida]|nr:hypothetical protein C8Q80DRAFT_1121610 [Daedaleopsis nitida]